MIEVNFEEKLKRPILGAIGDRKTSTLQLSDLEDFETAYFRLINEESALKSKNIIYLFKTLKEVPRMRGESDIVYIGKTKTSFRNRYWPIRKNEIKDFGDRYKYLIEKFEGLYIVFIEANDLNVNFLESVYLYEYLKKHLEYPPLNMKGYNLSHFSDYLD
ncbi:MAG: hypothetical protein CME63_16450 [Halobacteriovoraceae bacterium]|nr:hypothetical protein [Halobacteriovoraceae bacterium]